MKTIKKEIYRIDRVWFQVKEQQVVGDMYFTFQVADDTRNADKNVLISNTKQCIREYELGRDYEKNDKEQFPIYIVQRAIAYLELENNKNETKYNNRLDIWDIEGNWENLYTIAVCSEKYAKQMNINMIIDEYFL